MVRSPSSQMARIAYEQTAAIPSRPPMIPGLYSKALSQQPKSRRVFTHRCRPGIHSAKFSFLSSELQKKTDSKRMEDVKVQCDIPRCCLSEESVQSRNFAVDFASIC